MTFRTTGLPARLPCTSSDVFVAAVRSIVTPHARAHNTTRSLSLSATRSALLYIVSGSRPSAARHQVDTTATARYRARHNNEPVKTGLGVNAMATRAALLCLVCTVLSACGGGGGGGGDGANNTPPPPPPPPPPAFALTEVNAIQ